MDSLVNYIGSVAGKNVKLTTSAVVESVSAESVFNTLIVYVPKTFAESNLVSVPSFSMMKPGLVKADSQNYASVIKGDLLTQWGPVFDGGANIDCEIIFVVFENESSPVSISGNVVEMPALENAYSKTYFLGYRKFLFDPAYTGDDFTLPRVDGTPTILSAKLVNHTKTGVETKVRLKLVNTGSAPATVTAGSFTLETAANQYLLDLPSDVTLSSAMSREVSAIASSLETGLLYNEGDDITGLFISGPVLPNGIQILVSSAGTEYDAVGSPNVAASQDVSFVNSGESDITILSGTYLVGNLQIVVVSDIDLEAAGVVYYDVSSQSPGEDIEIETGEVIPFAAGILPTDVVAIASGVVQGFAGTTEGRDVRIPHGSYVLSTEEKTYALDIPNESLLSSGATSQTLYISSSTDGDDVSVSVGIPNVLDVNPVLPSGVRLEIDEITAGKDEIVSSTVVRSMYHKTSLALANLVNNTSDLSWFVSYLRINFDGSDPDAANACKIRNLSMSDQLALAPDLENATDPELIEYYWTYLYRLKAENTQVIVHCEDDFILADILKSWFSSKNASGDYVGNKTFYARLEGTRIKVFGGRNILVSSKNDHDEEGLDQFAEMNVGVLQGIGDGSDGAVLTRDTGVGSGLPCGAHMLVRKISYDLAKSFAQSLTSKDSVSNPVTVTQTVYEGIQRAVLKKLLVYQGIGRISNISLNFPPFATARVSRNSLKVPKAWSSTYQDDLTTLEISDSITV